jgi:predicted kinase
MATEVASPVVVMLCGLPASGKTTTAARLHAWTGGVLIRSCDVYQALGISLPDWVKRTGGFTEHVHEYDRVRDQAYREMARLLDESLRAGARCVILDAVHGEPPKRRVVYDICLAHGATPVIVLCECDDWREIESRFAARRGREREPEHEASDLAVYHDIKRRWQDPRQDRLPAGDFVTVIRYDTRRALVSVPPDATNAMVAIIRDALAMSAEAAPLRTESS